MKMLRTAAAFSFLLLACVSTSAQQVQSHAVPIGKGAGVTGFNKAAPSSTVGMPLVSQGASSDPVFGQVTNAGISPAAANTVKGSLDGATVTDIPLPSCTGANQAWRYASGVGINCAAVATSGFGVPSNLGLSASAAAGALTINITQADGTAPSSSGPVQVPFRSTAAATGTVTYRSITSALSLTIPSGSTLGTSNGTPFRVWVFLTNNSGTPSVGVATCSNASTVFPCVSWEYALQNTVAISAGATSGGTLYATSNVTLDAVRIVGYCDFASGLVAAGTWASSCTGLQVFGPGIKKPGEVVQQVFGNTGTPATCNSGTFTVDTNVRATLTPSSAVNLIEVAATMAAVASGAGGTGNYQVSRGGAPTMIGPIVGWGGVSATVVTGGGTITTLDAPATTSSTPYIVYCKESGASFTSGGGTIIVKEIMG